MYRIFILMWMLAIVGAGCAPLSPPTLPSGHAINASAAQLALQVDEQPLAGRGADSPCAGAYVAHDLAHVTATSTEVVHLFESNGSGLALNDLNNDGLIDIVLGNLVDPNSLLINQGQLQFAKVELPFGETRAISAVDVNGDGWLDLLFARRNQTRPVLWLNRGTVDASNQPLFEAAPFPVRSPYTMAWADMDQDGDLDLVAATYDTEAGKPSDYDRPLGQGGLILYEQTEEGFTPLHLAFEAQTLALMLLDVTGDQRPEILAGNDFMMPDQVWSSVDGQWQLIEPFAATAQNTMSLDAGDINNDGALELFAADMMPYARDPATTAAWAPLMADMHEHEMQADDLQVMENVLLASHAGQLYTNVGAEAGVNATGWSWSSKFGDLDNDGFLDLYVVNGMMAEEMFSHLPDNELVEENQAMRNNGAGGFVSAPEWRLNATASGRSMSMADLDNDGDLDIVVNNLRAPAQLFENQLCRGAALEVDLFWPASQNTRAVGAQLILYTSAGILTRDVRTASGYLSGDPARVHFGFPAETALEQLEIRWPDGAVSTLERPAGQMLLQITRATPMR